MAKRGRKQVPESAKATARGISAPPEWWEMVEVEAADMGLNASNFIRIAVDYYVKDGGKKSETEGLALAS